MQLMANQSPEGLQKGFGWIDITGQRLNEEDSNEITIPILGWNYKNFKRKPFNKRL